MFKTVFQDHITGRDHFLKNVLDGGKKENACVVSLGDLGESKSVDETKELFAGTSRCFQLARAAAPSAPRRRPRGCAGRAPSPPSGAAAIRVGRARRVYTRGGEGKRM